MESIGKIGLAGVIVALVGVGGCKKNAFVAKMEAFRDSACGCQEAKCLADLHKEVLEIQKVGKDAKGSKDDAEKVKQAWEAASKCMREAAQKVAAKGFGADEAAGGAKKPAIGIKVQAAPPGSKVPVPPSARPAPAAPAPSLPAPAPPAPPAAPGPATP